MMKQILICMLLSALPVFAGTNYVGYVKSTGRIVAFGTNVTYNTISDTVRWPSSRLDVQPDWADFAIDATTNNVWPATTWMSNLTHRVPVLPRSAEQAAVIEDMPKQFRAALRALVKCINLRLPVGQKITEPELKAAIKEELQ